MNQPDERILSGGIIQFVNRRCRRRFRESSFLVQLRNAPYDGNEEEEDEPKHTLSLSLSLFLNSARFFLSLMLWPCTFIKIKGYVVVVSL